MNTSRYLQIFKYLRLKNINGINPLSNRRMSFDIPGYKWEYMTAETFPAAMELMTKYFCIHEPVMKTIGLANNPKAVEEFELSCAHAALDGISVVVKDLASNEVIGVGFQKLVMTQENQNDKLNQRHYCTQPESKHFIIDLDDQIKNKVDLFKKYGAICTIEIYVWSVHPDHRDKKIGYLLVQASHTTAKNLQNGPVSKFTVEDLGPKYAKIEKKEIVTQPPKLLYSFTTSQKSQSVGKKVGFISECIISCNDLFYNGKSYKELLGDDDEFILEVITYLVCEELKRKRQFSHK